MFMTKNISTDQCQMIILKILVKRYTDTYRITCNMIFIIKILLLESDCIRSLFAYYIH